MVFRILLFFLFFINHVYAMECVPARDFGIGGTIYVESNPGTLIKSTPISKQIAPWISTNLTTTGSVQGNDGSYVSGSILRIYVTGKWAPFGGAIDTITTVCPLVDCNPSNPNDAICLADGKIVSLNADDPELPCYLDNGWGLYGLIAIDNGGVRMDPNDPVFAETLPSEYFRTFRIGPLTQDADGKYFDVKFGQLCGTNTDGSTSCITDQNTYGENVLPKGSLYFKIYDSFYGDNVGGYTASVVSGVSSEKGLIETAIDEFHKMTDKITKTMYHNIIINSGFISVIRVLLLTYVVISAILFLMGTIRSHQGELIVRLFKISILSILISDTSWEFFNTYLFAFFTTAPQDISNIIVRAAMQYSAQYDRAFIMDDTSTIFTAFDNLINIIKSPALHKKIAGLLFSKYFLYAMLIYLGIFILLKGIFRAAMLYIISMIIITILLVVAPIFFAMILFKLTKELFDGWLKQLLSNAILIITLAGAIALIVNLLLDQLFKILLFGVCWDIIYSFGISGYSIFDIYFWKVTDEAQVDTCLNVLSIFTFIIICILLDAFMQEIPQLVDSLSGAFLQPISHFNDGAMRALEGNAVYNKAMTFAGAIRSYASPGGLVSHHKMGRGLIAKGRELYDKGERKVFGNLQGSHSTPDTQIFKGARDKVGSVIDVAEKVADSNLITKGIKGVFEDKDR